MPNSSVKRLNVNSKATQTMVAGGSSPARENTHGRTGNRIQDPMASSQKFWPPNHETTPCPYRIRGPHFLFVAEV
jgi:hypothetical protein